MNRLLYDTKNAIVRDFGMEVVAVWTADLKLAFELRYGDQTAFDRVLLNPANEVEVIARLSRVYKYEGYEVGGWLISGNGSHAAREYAAATKVEAMKVIRGAVATYFTSGSAR